MQVCEADLVVPWLRVQDLLNAPPRASAENKNPANFSEAFRQEFLTPPQILADLIKNLQWEPREGEARRTDGIPITGAELESWKAQKKAALDSHRTL